MAAISAFGAVLKRGDGATPVEAFTSLGTLRNTTITGFGGTQVVDVTNHDSASSDPEFISGLRNAKTVSIEGLYDPANAEHTGLRSDGSSGTSRNFQLVLPDGGAEQFDFAAFVTIFEVAAAHDDAMVFTAELQITGSVTIV